MAYRTSYGFRHFARHLFLNAKKLKPREPKAGASRLEQHIQGGEDYILLNAQPQEKPNLSTIRKRLARMEKRLVRMQRSHDVARLLAKVKMMRTAIKGP